MRLEISIGGYLDKSTPNVASGGMQKCFHSLAGRLKSKRGGALS
jgi:hypothetical protein